MKDEPAVTVTGGVADTPARERPRAPYGIAVIVASVCALVLAASVYHAVRLREAALAGHVDLARNLARVSERELTVNLRMVDRLLETRAAQWRSAASGPASAYEDQLRADLAGVPFVRSVSVVNADGRIVASSDPRAAGRELEAPAIAALRGSAESPLNVAGPWAGRDLADAAPATAPVDPRATPYFFAMTRREGAADQGVLLVAAINASFIAEFYATLTQRPDFLIELYRYDGVLLVSTDPQRRPGSDARGHPVFAQLLPEREIGLIEKDPGPGGEADTGILAYRASRIYPVLIQVRLPLSGVLADWRSEMRQLAIATAAVLAGVLLLGVLLYRQQARNIAERRQAQRLREALHAIADSVHAAPNLRAMLLRIHEIVAGLLPARNCFVALYDASTREVTYPYFVDERDPTPAPRTLGERGIDELRYTDESLAVPLNTDGRTIGLFGVRGPDRRARYTERERTLLQALSDQIAVAIDRKLAEETLRASELRYRSVISAMAEGIIVRDENGDIIDCNASAERMAGEPLVEMKARGKGRPDWELYAEDGTLMTLADTATGSVLQTGAARANVVTGLRKPDGTMMWLSVNAQPFYLEAGSALTGVVTTFTDITEKKESEALIWQHANFDALTQLPNRRLFRDRLEQAIKQCKRDNLTLALLFMDLDRFKEVNDAFGHDRGDELLIEAARRIRNCVRDADTVARLGGDEFTVILPELENPEQAEKVAQNILDRLGAAFALGDDEAYVSASVGITLYPSDATEIEDLVKHADQALYVAKGAGRNRFSYFTPALQAAAQARRRLTSDLRRALENAEFSLRFQPMVELATGRIQKAEALLRWEHPQRGVVNPSEFIPAAEAGGLISDIGRWALMEATAWVKRWRDAGHPDFQVSVNQSPIEFQAERTCHAGWLEHLEALGLPGRSVTIEITEGLLLDASPAVREKLLRLRTAGVEVAIDDFGIGYSSLAYLKKFDIDYLKIDQSFISNLLSGSSDMALSEAIIVMAHKLGLKVIAEGVETIEQCNLLRAAGCDYAQGYLFAPPMTPEEFESVVLDALVTRAAAQG